MATAEKTETVTAVTLKMTEEEARALLAVLARVGGSPVRSPRKYVKAVYDAVMGSLGLRYSYDLRESELLDGTLDFRSGR